MIEFCYVDSCSDIGWTMDRAISIGFIHCIWAANAVIVAAEAHTIAPGRFDRWNLEELLIVGGFDTHL